jgi:hypothetical protein
METKGSPSSLSVHLLLGPPFAYSRQQEAVPFIPTRKRTLLDVQVIFSYHKRQCRRLWSVSCDVLSLVFIWHSEQIQTWTAGVINQILQRALKDGFSSASTSFQHLYFPSKRREPSRSIITRLQVAPSAKHLTLVLDRKLPPKLHIYKCLLEGEWPLSKSFCTNWGRD